MTDITDNELERRMRRKLFFGGKSSRGEQFTPEERAIADKIVGRHNVERLERREGAGRNPSRPTRRFRLTPVFIHYEIWWVNSDHVFLSGWRMARIENGKRSDHHWSGEVEDEVRRLKAVGYTVKEIPIEGAPRLYEPSRSDCARRKMFSERFQNFGKVKP